LWRAIGEKQRSRPTRARDCGQATLEQQANCSHGQQGHNTSVELIIMLKASQMAVAPQGRKTSQASKYFFYFTASRMAVAPRGHRHRGRATMFEKQANSCHNQQGHETSGELSNNILLQVASQMAVAPRGHQQRWCATKTFNSRPTAVTAKEGTRLRASYLICLLTAG